MASQGKPMAWVTLATTDAYALGALVLAHSLRQAGTAHRLVVMITPGVTDTMRTQLSGAFDDVISVDVMDSGDAAHLALMSRPELGVTLTKLHCWTLTQFSKCVFLDADCLVMTNCDELFEREELSAAPDIGWPDCFNSGVFVFTPSQETFRALVQLAAETGSFDGGDQGLLNTHFSDWATRDISRHLPFVYNMTASATYTYLPAFLRFGKDVKIVHFLGSNKPWMNPQAGDASSPAGRFHAAWWDIYQSRVRRADGGHHFLEQRRRWEEGRIDFTGADRFDNVWRRITENLERPEQPAAAQEVGAHSELVSGLAKVSLSPAEPSPEDSARRAAWERGQMDYMGSDSFENIMSKMNQTLKK
ncbi:Glycogenin-1 [Amphibalanus amphitrite]|uniref:glycogenin glucosyltransferase n=1 Tax=Amphibalanus amphitrite TaxID=1232801 RepID=A0A6A4V1B9_AMPAM|nr:Glycogenin-1 [Amphibalanus amphitrite]